MRVRLLILCFMVMLKNKLVSSGSSHHHHTSVNVGVTHHEGQPKSQSSSENSSSEEESEGEDSKSEEAKAPHRGTSTVIKIVHNFHHPGQQDSDHGNDGTTSKDYTHLRKNDTADSSNESNETQESGRYGNNSDESHESSSESNESDKSNKYGSNSEEKLEKSTKHKKTVGENDKSKETEDDYAKKENNHESIEMHHSESEEGYHSIDYVNDKDVKEQTDFDTNKFNDTSGHESTTEYPDNNHTSEHDNENDTASTDNEEIEKQKRWEQKLKENPELQYFFQGADQYEDYQKMLNQPVEADTTVSQDNSDNGDGFSSIEVVEAGSDTAYPINSTDYHNGTHHTDHHEEVYNLDSLEEEFPEIMVADGEGDKLYEQANRQAHNLELAMKPQLDSDMKEIPKIKNRLSQAGVNNFRNNQQHHGKGIQRKKPKKPIMPISPLEPGSAAVIVTDTTGTNQSPYSLFHQHSTGGTSQKPVKNHRKVRNGRAKMKRRPKQRMRKKLMNGKQKMGPRKRMRKQQNLLPVQSG